MISRPTPDNLKPLQLRELLERSKRPVPQVEASGKAGPGVATGESKPDDDRGERDRAEAERTRQEEERRAAQAREEAEQEAARLEREREVAKTPMKRKMEQINARNAARAQERDDYDPWDR